MAGSPCIAAGRLAWATMTATDPLQPLATKAKKRVMHDDSRSQTRVYWWLTVFVASIAVIGLTATGVGTTLSMLGVFTDGHPSLAALIYVSGRAWMHFVCPVGVVVGVVSIILSLRNESGVYWKLICLWTLANLVQASVVSGWP